MVTKTQVTSPGPVASACARTQCAGGERGSVAGTWAFGPGDGHLVLAEQGEETCGNGTNHAKSKGSV